MDKNIKMVKCPYCNKLTALRYSEFKLTYCEECGSTYGAKRHEDEMIIYTVQEAYRFDIE